MINIFTRAEDISVKELRKRNMRLDEELQIVLQELYALSQKVNKKELKLRDEWAMIFGKEMLSIRRTCEEVIENAYRLADEIMANRDKQLAKPQKNDIID